VRSLIPIAPGIARAAESSHAFISRLAVSTNLIILRHNQVKKSKGRKRYAQR
jgi:hypothetical protein